MAGVMSHFVLAEVERHPFPEKRRKTTFLWEGVTLDLAEDKCGGTGGSILTSKCAWKRRRKKNSEQADGIAFATLVIHVPLFLTSAIPLFSILTYAIFWLKTRS